MFISILNSPCFTIRWQCYELTRRKIIGWNIPFGAKVVKKDGLVLILLTEISFWPVLLLGYRISSVIRRSFFLPKQSQRSRSILQDGSRSLGLFRKGKIGIIAKFHRTDLLI